MFQHISSLLIPSGETEYLFITFTTFGHIISHYKRVAPQFYYAHDVIFPTFFDLSLAPQPPFPFTRK